MKKVVLIVLGVLGVLGGLALTIGGIALMALFGTDGTYNSSRERIDTATHALVSEPVELENDAPFTSDFGDVTVRLSARPNDEGPVFLGIGPAGEVDAYLRGVAIDVVEDWRYDFGDDDAIEKRRVDGTAEPDPPTEQDFWTVQASGPGEQRIEWELRSGTYRLVVMRADGSRPVDVVARWGIEIPWIFPLGIGLLVAGVVALLVGILLLVLGIRTKTRRPPVAPQQVGAWTAPN
jgi:hypothetical protein